MDHYKSVVLDCLQSDRAVFVNADCRVEVPPAAEQDQHPEQCHCDAVAIDMRHGAVYLCLTALDDELAPLLKKLTSWTEHWDSIKATLQREYKVPGDWRVHVWLFIPKATSEHLEEELERLRHTAGARFKVKLTALEEIQPWNSSTWLRQEEPWEITKKRTLV